MIPMITIEERPLRNAVSPFLCNELIIMGIDPALASSFYMVGDHQIFLRNYDWDHAGFYKETDQGYFEACGQPVRSTIPAFTASDMAMLLPPFLLTKNHEHDYECALDNWYQEIDVQHDRRMPDVMARMVIALLKHRIITPEMVNHQLA